MRIRFSTYFNSFLLYKIYFWIYTQDVHRRGNSVKAWWQWGSDFHLRFPAVALSLTSNTHQRRTSLDGDNKEKKVETIHINKRWRTWYLMGARVKKAMSPSSHSDLFLPGWCSTTNIGFQIRSNQNIELKQITFVAGHKTWLQYLPSIRVMFSL